MKLPQDYRDHLASLYRNIGLCHAVNADEDAPFKACYVPLHMMDISADPTREASLSITPEHVAVYKNRFSARTIEIYDQIYKERADSIWKKELEAALKTDPAMGLPGEPEPERMDSLLKRPPGLTAIFGMAGSGKSTFLKRAVQLMLEGDVQVCPVFLELAGYPEGLGWGGDHALQQWIQETLARFGMEAGLVARMAKKGELCLLLDGLDEIFDPAQCLKMAKTVGMWCSPGKPGAGCRVLVTMRTHLKARGDIRSALQAGKTIQLRPLHSQEQWQLVEGLLRHRQIAAREALAFWRQVQALPWFDEDFRGNPLLLTVLTLAFPNPETTLPRSMTELYEMAIDRLLCRRFQIPDPAVRLTKEQAREVVERVARTFFQNGKFREVKRDWLLKQWQRAGQRGAFDRAGEAGKLDTLACYSGVIGAVGHPVAIRFVHGRFQEYLTAHQLAAEGHPAESLGSDRLKEPAHADLAVLTMGSLWAMDDDREAWEMIAALTGNDGDAGGLDTALRGLLECPGREAFAPEDQRKLEKLKQRAADLIGDPAYPLEARKRLGFTLGRIGDPRLDPTHRGSWARIEAGPFEMGSAASPYEDEKPPFPASIRWGFLAGIRPVSNREYGQFVIDGGYEDERWWQQGWWWRQLQGEALDTWLKEEMTRFETLTQMKPSKASFMPVEKPAFWDNPFYNGSNQPVVGVNWYEARAYCAWLEEKLKKCAWFPKGGRVGLPTEGQWEYMAKGGDKREYPWGTPPPDRERANHLYLENGPTPVGLYRQVKTAETWITDLAGNVWEWCNNLYLEKGYRTGEMDLVDHPCQSGSPERIDRHAVRALRGGSWSDSASWLRCAFRGGNHASVRVFYAGFRCVVLLPPEP